MTSHYPTTAELRAFRGRLMSAPSIVAECPDSDAVRTWMTGTGWMSHPTASAAWWPERQHGIGYSTAYADPRTPPLTYYGEDYGTIARREAAALRSRAYAADFGRAVTLAPTWRPYICTDADIAAHQTFEPRPVDPRRY